MKRKWKVISLALIISVSNVLGVVNATPLEGVSTPTVPESGSTNTMTTSMLSFFRERLDNIDAGKISADEYRVLGVLISNFMIPGETTVKDIKGDVINKKVAESFLGSSEKASVIGGLTTKLYEGIVHKTDGLGSATEYTLTKGGKAITGKEFLEEIARGGSVSLKGKEVFDFGDTGSKGKVLRGAMQILMGVSPDIFIKVIANVSSMYMDGVGNIWGSPVTEGGASSVDDYILIMPGCLNPATFGGGSLPVNNAFAMGGMVDVNNVSNKEGVVPYYNIKEKMTGKDTTNMLNIYGIHSPTKYVGNTDSIIKGGSKLSSKELKKELEEYSRASTESKYDKDNLKVVVSLDFSKSSGTTKVESLLKGSLKGLSGKEKSDFIEYFGTNLVFSMNELQQDMYFFSEGGGNQGSFGDNQALLKNHLMFAEDKGGGKYSFYKNGYAKTPMTEKISSALKGASGLSKESEKLLIDGTVGKSITSSKYEGYMKEITGEGDLLYKTTPKVSKGSKRTYFASIFKVGGTVLGMGHKDTILIGSELPFYTETGKSPYGSNAGGGKIGVSLNEKDQESLLTLYHTTNTYNLFSLDNTIQSKLTGVESGTQRGGITVTTKIANGVNNWQGIYWAYTSSLLGSKVEGDKVKEGGWRNGILPKLTIATTGTLGGGGIGGTGTEVTGGENGEGGVSASEDKTIEDMQKDIVRKVYGILSEDDNSYRTNWIDRTIDGVILNWHRKLVGSWVGETFVVGTGKTYTSTVGYLSTPSLEELPLTNWMLKDYGVIYMFSVMVLTMIIVLMVLTNNRSWQEGILIFVLMCFVLMIPQSLIVNVVKLTNTLTDNMYSEKFNYWTISQHQEVLGKGLGEGSAEEDMNFTMNMTEEFSSSEARVRIKWMSPKKEEVFDKIYSTDGKLDGVENDLILTNFLMGNFRNQDEYITTSNESYLYRPYMEIVNSAKSSYEELSSGVAEEGGVGEEIEEGEDRIEERVPRYRFKGIKGELREGEEEEVVETGYREWGIGNESITKAIFRDKYSIEDAGLTDIEEDAEARAYLLLTESPYYYFYNVLKSRYGEEDFKESLLKEEVFKDTEGEIKDFLDLEGLFTNIIPYLKQSNEYVHGWTQRYGKKIENYDFEKGSGGEGFEEAKIRKEAMENVWKMYAPWVDGVYESAGGVERKGLRVIGDPINPGAYEEESAGREMVFSRAEMEEKGYNPVMMTDAEKRIQKVLEETYEDMMYLLNYYDFDDEVLLSVGAMMSTFNFNKSFSDVKLIGESTIIYPQNFELKNFNFDAFLRLMIVNATGEPMKAKDDLYVRLLEKTSIFTGLLLLLVDILGVIVIPTMKIVALVLIFILSVIIGFSCIIVPPNRIIQKVLESLGKPTITLIGIMLGFSYVMSLFMGEGYTSYIGSKTMTLGVTDPNILMTGISVASCVYVFLLFQVVKMLWVSLKLHSVTTVVGTVGVVGGLVSQVTSNVMNKVSSVGGVSIKGENYRGGEGMYKGVDMNKGEGGYVGGVREGLDNNIKDFESKKGETRDIDAIRNTSELKGMEDKEELKEIEEELEREIERLTSSKREVRVSEKSQSREEVSVEGKNVRESKREALEEMRSKGVEE